MLTKEECIDALSDLKKQLEDILGYESENVECINVLNQLINEHFYNLPLKFNELKEGMFVWDKKQNTWIEISEISEYQNIKFYMIGWECKETIVYEPIRFYRRKI